MKTLLVLMLFGFLINFSLKGQDYEVKYTYGASGNRIKRELKKISLNSLKSTKEEEQTIEEEWGDVTVSLFPNPTKGNLKVLIEGGNTESEYSYQVYNNAGTMVLNGTIDAQGEHIIPLSSFNSGLYFLILQKGEEALTYKIIKE
nr:T9SS type A sorting domain-containing protein [uncultured Carboxylicivirga sp.]